MTLTDWIGICSLVVAIVAAGAVWYQTRLLRFSLQVQSLLELEKQFNDAGYQETRHLAARQLQAGGPDAEVEEVLDFFDTLALLARRGAVDIEMVWHTFFYWIYGYWHAAKAVIDRERHANPRVWEDLVWLYGRVLAVENRQGVQRQEDVRDFLEYEVQQFKEEA